MPIQFYERVRIIDCKRDPDLVGRYGWALGMSWEDNQPDLIQGYSVAEIEGTDGLLQSFAPDEIEGTGEIAERSKFYPEDGASIRVRVENGRGYLVEED